MEEVKFTHHAHLELVMHDFGKFITHVLTSRTEYNVVDIYLNDVTLIASTSSKLSSTKGDVLEGVGVSLNVTLSDSSILM
ncbi:hypothetical protein Tco_1364086, partial [Tanacetum coccineum]